MAQIPSFCGTKKAIWSIVTLLQSLQVVHFLWFYIAGFPSS